MKKPFEIHLLRFFLLFISVGAFYGENYSLFKAGNIYPEKSRGWSFSLYTGIITNIWITVQQLLTDYFILQPIIASVGLLIIIFTLMPRVQKYFTIK